MISRNNLKIRCLGSAMAAFRLSFASCDFFTGSLFSGLNNTFACFPRNSLGLNRISDTQKNLTKVDETTHLGLLPSIKRNTIKRLVAPSNPPGPNQELTSSQFENMPKNDHGLDLFREMEHRFLSFKKHKYLKESEHYQTLAKAQSPKFMVIACADSRVCPSNILGFQPGEAFMIRNVANLVPPFEYGPSETNAALEFAVNTLEVENILVIGHSSCAGIETLMSIRDDVNSSSFMKNWIANGKVAMLRTKAAVAHLSFDQQCRHCEKESINRSLLHLLTYPWIEDRARKEMLSVHGGYYDFLNCTFEKWTLDFKGSCYEKGLERCIVKDQALWC
ncbi:beta carbonic anhydrase 5, chloroplastic-like isoform X2 [Malania oleifera]|uniref:beta carbonic anhydrase 5, chloroplastic-like isoform X2 n=1 Tax=Malania oleifera TaxID=397392 RepID=UPI0025AEA4B5|nr:beta carbonic anhydrase 5, chloroplastic-like isoform X2 [Malania oleifera]